MPRGSNAKRERQYEQIEEVRPERGAGEEATATDRALDSDPPATGKEKPSEVAGDELPEGPGERVPAVPRDLPDQQAHADDPLDVPEPEPPRTGGGREPDPELPDPDQPGAGPRGAPRKAGPHPEQPVPDEPSG